MAKNFSDADAKKLAELLEKQKQAKAEERNEAKRNDRLCQKLFGMSVKEVKDKLNGTTTTQDYWSQYYECKSLIERFQKLKGKEYNLADFENYINYLEQKANENNQ